MIFFFFFKRSDHCFVRNELLLIRKYSRPFCKFRLERFNNDSRSEHTGGFIYEQIWLINIWSIIIRLVISNDDIERNPWLNEETYSESYNICRGYNFIRLKATNIYGRFWFDVSTANIKGDIDVPLRSRSIHVAPFVTERGVECDGWKDSLWDNR